MKLIGAGFGRTGTLSLKVALERLGFGPCYHMFEVFEHPEHAQVWLRAASGEDVDWEDIFAGYQAAVDWPAAAFYARLMEAYPRARVLLSVRPPERWYESAMNTIARRQSATDEEPATPEQATVREMIDTVIWQGTFDGRMEDRAYAISVYERHIADVQERVPDERLLVYSVAEGWEPLCRFLDVPVPEDEPFPRLNDTRWFLEQHES